MVRGLKLLAVSPLHVIQEMAAVLALVEAHRHEPRLGRHEARALRHQLQHLGLVVRRHLDGRDLGDDVGGFADFGHGRAPWLRLGQRACPDEVSRHTRSLSCLRASIACAIATVRRAMSACNRSIMRPSSCTAPLSLFSGNSNAAMMSFACATSSALGENAVLHGLIWFGWMSVLPSNPMSHACAHSRAKPSASARSL